MGPGAGPPATAVSFVPSAEDATPSHSNGGMVLETQVRPKSAEVKSGPVEAAATRWLPSVEEATENQLLVGTVAVDQFAPASVEIETWPRFGFDRPAPATTRWVPSAEEAMLFQYC